MRSIPFVKAQSIGNDFVLIALDAFASDSDLVAFTIRACERRFGIGSDGLLALGKGPGADRLTLRMFNPDGSEDFCGNGLRCAARYALDNRWIGDRFTIHHLGREVTVCASGEMIATELGLAVYDPSQVPLAEGLPEQFEAPLDVAGETLIVSALTTGSTHTVIFVDQLPDDARFSALSPLIENHEAFPHKTSVIWTQRVAERKLKLRIWERAVGETLGCGSGSSAAAAAYFRKTGLSGSVEVVNPGGAVTVSMADWRAPITISGRAQVVFGGQILVD